MAIKGLIHRSDPDFDLRSADRVWIQTFMHRHAGPLREDGVVPFLNGAKRELARTGRIDIDDVADRFRFQIVRGRPDHADVWLTNRLISEYVPRDFLTRYVFNKQGFYADYDGYDESYRAFVVETLKKAYLTDKAALRARLFGLS